MMLRLQSKLLTLLLIVIPTFAWALPSDRDKPIEIEADHAQIDDTQGITQYKGKAVLTQGTLRIEGDIITFYYDDDKQLSKAIAQGNLATYQQVQKQGETPVKARALQMEYHARSQFIYLIGKGHVWQNGDEFSGARIEYDIAKNIVNASSNPATTGRKSRKSERIHIIIQPPSSKQKKTTVKKPQAIIEKPVVKETTATAEGYPTAVISTNLNVRTGPGTQYHKLGIFSNGSLVYILTEQKEWVQVRGTIKNQAIIGWVSRRYIQETN
ncbi:lipopolysaccharide transport periplasmic protein LptA [Pseudomonadota bacterium]|nr:lipopolysaccharide transport periplasmic protein LptA [Pseudomonadota bacterium]